jgi:hypothetical protein
MTGEVVMANWLRTLWTGARLGARFLRRNLAFCVVAVREGVAAIACGLAAGGLASVAIGRSLRSALYDVAPTDIVVVAGVTLVLSAAAMMAYYLPTRAVSTLNPVDVLRDESGARV